MSYVPPVRCPDPALPRAPMSSGKSVGSAVGENARPVSGDRIVTFRPRVFDPIEARRAFPALWSAWLRSQFPSHLVVAVVFSVNEKTARLWWEGVNAPQGWAVSMARDSYASAAEMLRVAA